jgi:CheY-like chemotaxis protein
MRGRVLVVDDNAVNALVASAMLQRIGLDIDVVEDGAAALERMQGGDLDLVLMDCQLPVLDGWEATRRWRRTENAGTRLPIIALTANAVMGDRERCLQAGMDDYLAKPVEMSALFVMVSKYLDQPLQQRAG